MGVQLYYYTLENLTIKEHMSLQNNRGQLLKTMWVWRLTRVKEERKVKEWNTEKIIQTICYTRLN